MKEVIRMDNQELRKILEQLHGEIGHIDSIDEKGKILLRDLGTDIRELLERSENNQAQLHPSTVRNLEDTIDYFEVTHPNLTSTLSKLLSVLSNAGI
jgi:hypothetical protein